MALKFDFHTVLNLFILLFEQESALVNYESPYRTAPKKIGRNCSIQNIYVLGLVLWYLMATGRQQKIAPVFRLVTTSLSVWIDYRLEVLYKVFRCCSLLIHVKALYSLSVSCKRICALFSFIFPLLGFNVLSVFVNFDPKALRVRSENYFLSTA